MRSQSKEKALIAWVTWVTIRYYCDTRATFLHTRDTRDVQRLRSSGYGEQSYGT
jgi:hypothetical protein